MPRRASRFETERGCKGMRLKLIPSKKKTSFSERRAIRMRIKMALVMAKVGVMMGTHGSRFRFMFWGFLQRDSPSQVCKHSRRVP